MKRREFFKGASAGLLVPLSLGQAQSAESQAVAVKRIRFGLSTYSYWHFKEQKVGVETVINRASELGFDGVDILHKQMDSEEPAYLFKLKQAAFRSGVDLICLSTHQSFLFKDEKERKKNIDLTINQLRLASELGIPCIRINTGRWGVLDFDNLMKQRGVEPVPEGLTEDMGYQWVIESLEQLVVSAQKYGVMMALENHWGLARTPEGLLRILDKVKSPYLAALMDTGNYLENPYDKLKQIAERTAFVQAKTYQGGGEWYTLDLDYTKIAALLKAVNYSGYISLEFEGKNDPDLAVPESLVMLKKAFA